MSFLSLQSLTKTYPDGTQAVKGIDLAVDEGELIVLLGPSGCGKTTTLRMIAGLELPTSGAIQLDGHDITGLRPSQRDVGFVFQFYALYPHLNVEDNIAFPLQCLGLSRSDISTRLDATLAGLGLSHLRQKYPRQLSGGDQQRVALGRAMIRQPRLWLMDEPLGTLDADQRFAMREFIRSQQQEHQVTTIYVTHDQEEAMSMADRVIVMDAGKIQQTGNPAAVYDTPANLFVAQFVGSPGMNFITGTVSGSSFQPHGPSDPIPLPQPVRNGPGTLGIRGEFVHPDPTGPVAGKVVLEEYLGSHRCAHIETGFGTLIMRLPANLRLPLNEPVRVRLGPEHIQVFEPRTGERL
jgi:multiple sugar transport system ATP-binding protein